MAKTATIEVKERNPITSLQGFLKTLLEKTEIDAILVAQHLPMKSSVMPTLVTDPEKLEGADPFAPAFPFNASKVLSRLTRKSGGGKLAAVLRPCEIRAFIELVKLKQGSIDRSGGRAGKISGYPAPQGQRSEFRAMHWMWRVFQGLPSGGAR
jgi:formate dehydrogenase (coenzyme F420) beta subunit